MTKEEFMEAFDWAAAAEVDPGGHVVAEELRRALVERIHWLESIEPKEGDLLERKANSAVSGVEEQERPEV